LKWFILKADPGAAFAQLTRFQIKLKWTKCGVSGSWLGINGFVPIRPEQHNSAPPFIYLFCPMYV
jgi:hypothetical protein